MKTKLLSLLSMLIISLSLHAQGTWSEFNRQADELIGEPGGKYYKFSNDTLGAVIVREGDDWIFRVESYNGEFYSKIYNGSVKRVTAVNILMGLYDANGKLLEKLDDEIEGEESQSFRIAWTNEDWAYTPGKRAKFRKMVSGMLSGNGYVRIVIKRMNMPAYDFKITPYKK